MNIGVYRYANHTPKRTVSVFFYSGDGDEPAHVHVQRDNCEAKFCLNPVRLERSGGFASKEINKIQKLIEENQQDLLEKWDDFFNS